MLWNNKGHQFDKFLDIWKLNEEYYIWGTSTLANSFYEKFNDKIKIKGYIDNNKLKQGSTFKNKLVYSISEIKDKKNIRIIVASGAYYEIKKQLKGYGLKEGENFCDSRLFEGVYYLYKYNKVYLYRTDISITSKCNLKCKKCNMFMPMFNNPKNREFIEIKDDIDTYFKWVDNLHLLNLLGGEPFLHPEFNQILEYIGEKYYRKNVEHIEIFTNGTIIPSDEIIETCKRYNISIQVSDYTNALTALSDKVNKFIQLLEDNNITYRRNINEQWLDFGNPLEYNNTMSDQKMIEFFDECYASFRGVYNKKFYYCHLNSSAVNCNIVKESNNDYFDLTNFEESKKKKLLEFDMGYNNKGYLEFCRHCNGCFAVNDKYVAVAEQMEKRMKNNV